MCVTTYEDLTKAHGYKHLIGGSARGGGVVLGMSFPATGESEKNNALSSRRLDTLMKRSESPKITSDPSLNDTLKNLLHSFYPGGGELPYERGGNASRLT